jgi:hypothetical protein
MPHTYLPRLTAPVERTITGTIPAEAAGVEQSFDHVVRPFADEGDE